MFLIDTHAHLTFDVLRDDIAGVLERAHAAGVHQILTVGTSAEDSRQAVALAESHAEVAATAGIHPHEAAKATDDDLGTIAGLLDHPKVVGVGEIGLDYHYDFSDRASQRRVFEAQLEIASRREWPLVIHCREAVPDTIGALCAAGFEDRPVVFHCFTGTADDARRIASRGWRISFTGIVTFPRSSELQAIARAYPADQLMIETDSPYLSPVPVRKIRINEPANLIHTARYLAALRGEPLDVLVGRTTSNAREFFRLNP